MTASNTPKRHLVFFGGEEELEIVAWHGKATFSGILKTSARHLRRQGAYKTLCGVRVPLPSRRVIPNSYWTDKDCERCMRSATQGNATRRRSLEVA